MGRAPPMGGTVELALFARVAGERTQMCESGDLALPLSLAMALHKLASLVE